jgi:hypothetical protein
VSEPRPETVFDMADILKQLNTAFTTAAVELRKTFDSGDWEDSPFVYHMPKMHISMRMVLSHSDGKVKGWFWNKESKENTRELASTVEIDLVAVPRLSPKVMKTGQPPPKKNLVHRR